MEKATQLWIADIATFAGVGFVAAGAYYGYAKKEYKTAVPLFAIGSALSFGSVALRTHANKIK